MGNNWNTDNVNFVFPSLPEGGEESLGGARDSLAPLERSE